MTVIARLCCMLYFQLEKIGEGKKVSILLQDVNSIFKRLYRFSGEGFNLNANNKVTRCKFGGIV
jgi:hypothetical protein